MADGKFKNDYGVHYLKALFWEECVESDKAHVIYSLKNKDHIVDGVRFPSIQRLYMEENDPTEYNFAIKYFDSWKHWKMVRECPWMRPVYAEMKEELELRIRSQAVAALRELAADAKNGVQVNKWLVEKGFNDKDDKRGRPSKEAIKKEADKLTKEHDYITNDYGRIVSLVS